MFPDILKSLQVEDKVLNLGYQNIYLQHGNISELEHLYSLDEEKIYQRIIEFMIKQKDSH